MTKLLHSWNPEKENCSIIGANQEGKSTFAKAVINDLHQQGFNIIILDAHRIFTDLDPQCIKTSLADIKGEGLEIYQPFEISEQIFIKLCEKIYNQIKHYVVFVIDELHNYVTKYKAPKILQTLCENCNNRDIGYIAIYHAPSEVPNFILRTSNIKFVFYIDIPADVRYMKDWIGDIVLGFNDNTIQKFQAICKIRHEEPILFDV
jgi:hypothetical protein